MLSTSCPGSDRCMLNIRRCSRQPLSHTSFALPIRLSLALHGRNMRSGALLKCVVNCTWTAASHIPTLLVQSATRGPNLTIWRTQQPDPLRPLADTRHGRPPGLHGLQIPIFGRKNFSSENNNNFQCFQCFQKIPALFHAYIMHTFAGSPLMTLRSGVIGVSAARFSCTFRLQLVRVQCVADLLLDVALRLVLLALLLQHSKMLRCQTFAHGAEWRALNAVAAPAITLRNMTKQRQSHRIEDWSTLWRCSQQERLPDDSLATLCPWHGTRARSSACTLCNHVFEKLHGR
jgi:hypothetical protein